MSEASTSSVGSLVKRLSPVEWLTIAGVLIAIVMYKRYKANQAATAAAQPDLSTLAGMSGLGGLPGLLANANPTSGQTNQTTSSPMDNESWMQSVISALLHHGGYTPLEIEQALNDFINGNPLTTREQQIVNAGINLQGAPPLGVPSITLLPPAPIPPSAKIPVVSKPAPVNRITFPKIKLPARTASGVYVVSQPTYRSNPANIIPFIRDMLTNNPRGLPSGYGFRAVEGVHPFHGANVSSLSEIYASLENTYHINPVQHGLPSIAQIQANPSAYPGVAQGKVLV